MIKLLIVEDSKVVSEYLNYFFSNDPKIQVIGSVSNGQQAIDFIKGNKPDVITMDIDMPIMDGLEATKEIMSTTPIPILIVTASRNARELSTSIEALAAGALAVIEKPTGINHPKSEDLAGKLINMVKVLSEVPVITRRKKVIQPKSSIQPKEPQIIGEINQPKIVAIGVSSGGPQTLHTVFSKISGNFPAPILVVQHIAPGFIRGLIDWLQKTVNMPIHLARKDELALPGHIYFAPDGYHLGIAQTGHILLEKGNGNSGFCPSVAYLFLSVKENIGEKAMAIILTGMGHDGAEEMKQLHDLGAVTIAQSKDSALINGMPGVAVQIGAATYILSDEEISILLVEIENKFGNGKQ
jgi:two-component system, chemotaxis family, protein-glutamate methylesterase/glutaminase